MKSELIAVAAVAATMIGIAAYGHHQKGVADELRGELAQCALRASHAEASLDALAREAKERVDAAQKALEVAQKNAQRHSKRADDLLKRPPAVPGDDCASAKVRAHDWLEARQ